MAKKYFHIKITSIPLYGGIFGIIVSNDVTAIREHISEFDAENSNTVFGHTFLTPYDGKESYFIVLNPKYEYKKLTQGTIAHEALHVTTFVLNNRGININIDNDEAAAYFLDWVVDKTNRFLRLKGFKIN